MTEDPTKEFRSEHRELLEHINRMPKLADELPSLSDAERSQRLREITDFLEGTLLPHAEAEERALYPAVAKVLGDPRATGPMSYDHVAIGKRIAGLVKASIAGDVREAQRLLDGLHALIIVHFEKEEEDYLPLLRESMSTRDLERLFEEMGHAHAHH